MRFIDFCMADPESVKSMSESILEYLGQPATKLQRKALASYHSDDSTQLTQLLSLSLGDPYVRCLRCLNSAARSSDPETAGEFMDKAIEAFANWGEPSQDKKSRHPEPDRLTVDEIFQILLEN